VDRLQWNSFDWLLSDGDLINVTIDHNVVGGDAVEFVLEAGPLINWWKAILLPGNRWIWTQDWKTQDSVTVPRSELHGDLQLGKAKFLGVHQGVYLLDSLEQLQAGDRVTFAWLRDGAPWRNVAGLEQEIHAPFIQGRGYWVKPGSQFSCTMKVTNDGDPWYPGAHYRLGSWDPQDNLTWGLGRVDLDGWLANVGPNPRGAPVDFTVTAPATEGEYRFSWRMVQDGVEWFGEWTGPEKFVVGGGGTTYFFPAGGQVVVAVDKPAPVSPPPPTDPPPPTEPPPTKPPPPTSGDELIGLSELHDPRNPDLWYMYTADSGDPTLSAWSNRPPAKIASVTNKTGYKFTLLHQDRDGLQSPPVNFGPNETVSVGFEGMKVEGHWTAQFSGTRGEAPYQLLISVHWGL